MSEFILHHYDTSPFSEKVRLIFGAKGISWRSVVVPVMMPKPDVVALTGGYRRTPFLQLGADIYCDTALMCRVIDKAVQAVPLYPAAVAGLAEILAQWADSALFWAAVPYTIQPASFAHMFGNMPGEFLQAFMADRAAMTGAMRRPTTEDSGAQTRDYLGRLEQVLGHKAFLLGDAPCIADFAVVQSLWFIHRAPPVATILEPFTGLAAWYARMLGFGHGVRTEISAAEAIDTARNAGGFAPASVDEAGWTAGEAISVTPTDYAQDPVAGRLVGIDGHEVVLAREDARAGLVHVHFPRVGFQIAR